MRLALRMIGFLGTSALAMLLLAIPAGATTLGFSCLTNNLAGDCAIGEAQLSVDVLDIGGGQVAFEFHNSGPDASVISEIYYDDGSLLALANVIDGPGVDIVQDASPPNLPGGNLASPPFVVSSGFLAQSVPAVSMNGVGPGEWVQIVFDLQPGRTYSNVLTDLSTGDLRIGIHVISYASGGSESFLNVPEPGTLALLMLPLAWAGVRRRRR